MRVMMMVVVVVIMMMVIASTCHMLIWSQVVRSKLLPSQFADEEPAAPCLATVVNAGEGGPGAPVAGSRACDLPPYRWGNLLTAN